MRDEKMSTSQDTYQIIVNGKLDSKWNDWFDGFVIVPRPGEETLLSGTVADQAALHGLLAKIRDLGLPLISVKWMETEQSIMGHKLEEDR